MRWSVRGPAPAAASSALNPGLRPAVLAAVRPFVLVAHAVDRQDSRASRSVTTRREGHKKFYAEDPFYRDLTLLRRRLYRAGRKELDNARLRRRWASNPQYREKARARRYGLTWQTYQAILAEGEARGIAKMREALLVIGSKRLGDCSVSTSDDSLIGPLSKWKSISQSVN